jgi:hypothetical protein
MSDKVFDYVLEEGGEKTDLFSDKQELRDLPLLTKLGINIGEKIGASTPYIPDEKSYQILWNIAIDEYGYDPKVANQLNIFKLATMGQFTKDKDLFSQLGKDIEALFVTEPDAENPFYGITTGIKDDSRDNIKVRVINAIDYIDNKYDIYKDEGLPVVKDIIENDHLQIDKLRDLFHDKYKHIYTKESLGKYHE